MSFNLVQIYTIEFELMTARLIQEHVIIETELDVPNLNTRCQNRNTK